MNKKKQKIKPPTNKTITSINQGWVGDVNSFLTIQRNFFIVLSIVSIFGVIIAMIVIKSLIEKNSIEPYVISTNTRDNMPVHIKSQSAITYKEANPQVIEFFIMQYIKSREDYNFFTYKHNYTTVTKPMSSYPVYKEFLNTVINDEKNNPLNIFGEVGEVQIIFKQITHDKKNNIITVRIAKKIMKSGITDSVLNFQIQVAYSINVENIKASDIEVNPLGISIDSYKIVEEKTIIEDEVVF